MKTSLAGLLVLTCIAFGMSRPAHAALIERSMLIEACTSHSQAPLNNCAGYIAGVADMVDSTREGVCIPRGLKIDLLRKGVANYLQSHMTGNGPAAPAVLDALRTLYRCVG